MRHISWINLLAGIWLMVAAFLIGGVMQSAAPGANDIVVGILLVASSWWLLAAPEAPVGAAWFQVLCGGWLMISAYALRYGHVTISVSNALITGLIVAVVGLIEAGRTIRRPA